MSYWCFAFQIKNSSQLFGRLGVTTIPLWVTTNICSEPKWSETDRLLNNSWNMTTLYWGRRKGPSLFLALNSRKRRNFLLPALKNSQGLRLKPKRSRGKLLPWAGDTHCVALRKRLRMGCFRDFASWTWVTFVVYTMGLLPFETIKTLSLTSCQEEPKTFFYSFWTELLHIDIAWELFLATFLVGKYDFALIGGENRAS